MGGYILLLALAVLSSHTPYAGHAWLVIGRMVSLYNHGSSPIENIIVLHRTRSRINTKMPTYSIGIAVIYIRWSRDRLVYILGTAIASKDDLYTNPADVVFQWRFNPRQCAHCVVIQKVCQNWLKDKRRQHFIYTLTMWWVFRAAVQIQLIHHIALHDKAGQMNYFVVWVCNYAYVHGFILWKKNIRTSYIP